MPNSCEDSWNVMLEVFRLQLTALSSGFWSTTQCQCHLRENVWNLSVSLAHLQQAWWAGIMGWKLILTSNVRSVSWHKHSKVWFAGFYVNCKMPCTRGCNDGPISLRRYVGVHNGLSHLWSAQCKGGITSLNGRSGCTTARHVWIEAMICKDYKPFVLF